MAAYKISTKKWLKNKVSQPSNLKVVLKEDKSRRVTPSLYTQEMLKSTEERLANNNEIHGPVIVELLDLSQSTNKVSLVDLDQAPFQPYPSELVFQNFTPAQTYKLPLRLFNSDKVSRNVKVELQDSQYFHVVGSENAQSKVAPGLSATFTVSFTPQENKDYNHKLVCVTERELFEVPIRAIGPRAILDFRDEFNLPLCAVKASTERTQLVCNVGNSKAKFKLYTKKPFSVMPSSGSLDVGESMQVTVVFHPVTIGNHNQDLLVHYHTGEDVYISLYGVCEELNIHLDPDSVLLTNTYISLVNVHTVSLVNTSEIPLQYHWSMWSSQKDEDQDLRESSGIQQKEEKERLLVLSRAIEEHTDQAAKDHLLAFSDSCITVEPLEGEIWPKMTAHFKIVFKPEEAKIYEQTIYCDVTGCESQLPLTVRGEGMGPKIKLKYDLMDMKNVFIDEKYSFKVLVSNVGPIDAPFRVSSPDTTVGRCFSFKPEEGVVPSGACQTMDVTFHSRFLGTFSEDLLLTVTGQPQPLILTFRGCVIGPTFNFNVSELNFGDVAFGFPQTLICTLFNTSFVPMAFALRVLGDGLGSPSINSTTQVSEMSRNSWQGSAAKGQHMQPVEFTVNPAAGSVRAMSDITIKVTLCSNTVKQYRLALVVDVEGVGKEIMNLPISARCVVPEIVVETPMLDFKRCFLDYPYHQQVRLTNPNNLPVCYGMLDQEFEESPLIIFGSSVPRGVIRPHSSGELPVFLLAKTVGKLSHSLRIAVFGSVQSPLEVGLSCIGQGPVVLIQSPQLNFGRIPVLTDIARTLHLSNQSPIPAHFTACMSNRKSFWHVEPSEGNVPSQSQIELKVVAHLKDTLPFQESLKVSIQDSQTYTIPLSATGTGTTIVSNSIFGQNLDLGTCISHGLCQYNFQLTNHGQRIHRLYWGTDGFLPSKKSRKGEGFSRGRVLPPISATKKKVGPSLGSLVSACKEKPVFSLTPSRVELFPGGSIDMLLTGTSDSPKVVQERLVCRGIVGNQGCYEHIMSINVTCRFVAPMLSISSKCLNFYIEKVLGKNLTPLYEKLVLKNVSGLRLAMELSLVEPFSLSEAPGAHISATTKSIVLGDGKQADLWVCFNPSYCQDQVSRFFNEVLEIHYQGHPQQDMVELHAEVHFPNLHFSSTAVDFGCVLNLTHTHRVITITNCSPLPVSFHWTFLENHITSSVRAIKTHTKIKKMLKNSGSVQGEGSSRKPSASSGPVCVNEVFDILPSFGHLQPKGQQIVTFDFYGHKDISREVVAQCHVEDGPTYEIKLRGETSVIQYSLNSTYIDFGQQLFYLIGNAEVTIRNTGKMGFRFSIKHPWEEGNEDDDKPGEQRKVLKENKEHLDTKQQKDNEKNDEIQEVRPGQPMVIPSKGYIDAGMEQCLHVLYLPGIPEVFEKSFQLQVDLLPPQDITLTGKAIFPRISLNLPQNLEECYSDVVQQARAAMETNPIREELNGITTDGPETTEPSCTMTSASCLQYAKLLHMEMERILVKENALAVTARLLELRDSQCSSKKWHKLSKFLLPEYILDFGFVISGKILSHTVNITNNGLVPVSFHANCKPLVGTGFSVEFERVKNLPCGEIQMFTVKFDPQGAKAQTQTICVTMPIEVIGGPVVQVQLCAVMTMPAITVSTDELFFDTVQCGMCQMKTVQLSNRESVPCQWRAAEEVKSFKKVDKFLPLHQRKKVLEEWQPPPVVFEMFPSSCMLSPGERVNVQIKFSPTEGIVYNRRLVVRVAKSTQQLFITAQGQGEEPQLEFCPSVLELGPCLPASTEAEAEITVRNPCSFPIEFYSLEFDTQYLEEEKILRLMKDYDDNNLLLLPPRAPGENLPTELLDYYNELCSQLKDDAKLSGLDKDESEIEYTREEEKQSKHGSVHPPESKDEEMHSMKSAELFISEMNRVGSGGKLGQLELTPVSRALARHMCIDLSPAGLAARNRRGIAIIVYGAPKTGKSSTATALAQHYRGTYLSVDAVVTDVLMNGNSPVSLSARQLYDLTVAEYTERKAQEAAEALGDTSNLEPLAHPETSDTAPNSDSTLLDVGVPAKPSDESCSRNDSKAPHMIDHTHVGLCIGGDVITFSSLLPEQLLADILTERFQLSDCHNCIVIDGLESAYTHSVPNTLQVLLKALNNFKHIYVVHLSISPDVLKAQERSQQEREEVIQKEKANREEQWLQGLDEEEYDSLPKEQKEQITQRLRELQQDTLRDCTQTAKAQKDKTHQEEVKDDDLKKKGMAQCTDADEDINVLHAEFPLPTDTLEREKIQKQVEHILQHWDLDQSLLLVPLPSEETISIQEDASAEQHSPVGRRTKKVQRKSLSSAPCQMAALDNADKEEDRVFVQDIISHIVVNVTDTNCCSATELYKCGSLPSLDEVLDDLDLGSSGTPIPSTIAFSVIPFPKNRGKSSTQLTSDCFTFLVPSVSEEQGEKKSDLEEDMQALALKEEGETASKSRYKGNIKESAVAKDKKGKENLNSKRRATTKTKGKGLDHSPLHTSTTFDCAEQEQTQEILELKRKQSLSKFRWVVPAKGEVLLKIWFSSNSPGKFEQIFNFELLGTQRHYHLVCKGMCIYPSICNDYKTIFALTKKVQKMEEGLQKTYIIKPGYFEFGPLICSKTRDRYKENKYPENTERLVIHNNSGLNAEIWFHFQHDTQATTFLLDPPTMSLKPDQKQELTVWAYPTKPGQIKDSVLCCIKDNPEFVVINFSCWGVQPYLELESKHLHFDRVLIQRRDTSTVTLHNKTILPVSWRVQGLEELGDEFSMPQDQGIISPKSSFPLTLHFRARMPLHIKKILRVEVSDVEKILGIVHTENIQVSAEAYDIALDMSPDGCLDFGTIRVFEESKLSLRMKNQGKYKIFYKFIFEQTDPTQPNLESFFTVSPQCGTLMPHEKPEKVQIICRPTTEVLIKEQPILPCQVVEPSLGNGGETVAIIAIKVSVQSVFSRYKITPACDIDFGPLIYGCKKTQSFTIENNGVFETDFMISMIAGRTLQGRSGFPVKKIPIQRAIENQAERPVGHSKVRPDSVHKHVDGTQNRLTFGVFSVFPCAGNLQPGFHQVVNVECVAEQLGNWNQGLLIDISHRDPSDQPEGIPYRLLAEVCKPVIALDMASIFEEHHLCHNSRQLLSEQFRNAEGVYLLDEKRFIFNNVLVGQTAQARLKLTNNSKVPCDLYLAIKYSGTKTSRNVEVFDVSATTLSIPSQSHSFAVVTFTPQTMQLYSAVFEATLEATNRMMPTYRHKVLEFDLLGEGNMPRVCVVRPSLKNNRGIPVLQFRRVLVGRRQTLTLVLLNDGTVPAQVQIDMLDEHGVFSLNTVAGNICSSIYSKKLDSDLQLVHRAILRLNCNEQIEFEVSFCSDKPRSVKATMSLQVQDNIYKNTIIQVIGEAYQEIVSLDNISRSPQEEGIYEVLNFGDCYVDCPYQKSFTITNHSSSQVVRFEWPPAGPHVCFSPQVGHLHAGCSKEVTVTFSSKQPVTLNSQPMRCKVCQVEFKEPLEEVTDWDDRQRTVQWLSTSQQTLKTQPQQSGKKKVIQTDPEPCCSVIEGSQWELELCVSAVCDYVKFSCNTDTIQFKDTMLCQTRSHQLQIMNQGGVKLEFSWNVLINQSSNSVNDDERGETSTSRPGSHSVAALSGVRPSSALARLMSVLTHNPELLPFSVEPSVGAIMPGSMQEFTVSFSPLKVAQFQGGLVCSIPNLQKGDRAPLISVCGRSLLPPCHFDLEESDYISGNRRNPEFRGSLDPNTQVIEFNAVGISAQITRYFSVVNPTSIPYSFKWKCEDKDSRSFRCLTQRGTILPGKKVEMSFKYVAEQMATVESFWSFVIDTLSLSIPFLCVGNAREPLVYLSRPHLSLGELLVGHKVERTVDVVNGESEPFYFSVLQSSLLCEDQQSGLILQPKTGNVAPNERLPLSLSFTPCREGYVSFILVLRVKRKSEPLRLTVKADCFSMSTLVQVENPDGGFREINPNQQDTLDFGNVGISEESSFNCLVSNLARFSMEVNFEVTGPSELLQHLNAKPQNAVIAVGKQLKSSLFFYPQRICNLQNVRLSIKVKHGPTFNFAIKGRAVASSLEFSFTKFNFGKCLLYHPDLMPTSKTLVISNKGKRDISIQCQFSNTSYLEIDFHPNILTAGSLFEVPLTFYPHEACEYHEKLTFILNSCITKHVDILGQGVEMKLELEDPKQRKVKLGSLMLGQKVKKQVVVVNRSLVDLSFTLVLNTNTPLDPQDLTFSPSGELNLKAGSGSCNVEIQFSPRQHISPFTAELQAQFAGLLHPLLIIQGCCQDVTVQLDQDYLAFGAVVQHCQARKMIILMNKGDHGARFKWKTKNFPPELSISPAEGYICPGMDVPFEVTFSPQELSNDIRLENLSCFVEGSSSPVTLTATGSCIVASTSKEVVNFVCPVRGSHTQMLSVFNPSNQRCTIRPVIEGGEWSAVPSLTLQPLQNKTYEITYQPLTMTAEGKKHLGSAFFSFPDGTAMVYSLQGTADPPKAENTIVHELPAKTQHTEQLPVHNWLTKQQRFHVLKEMMKPDKPDATVSLKGLEYIDVPALGKRNYKISFFTYKEGQYNTKVTFLNEVTGEYLFYLITFKATSPGVLSTIELLATVRRTVSATIQVENPLTTATCLTTECKCADISVPLQHTVPGQSKGSLSFEYQPLRAGESTARLTLCSNELGYFHYDLLLNALPPPPEKAANFSASLGSSHTVLVKFINYSRSKTEYSCKTDCPDFTVERSVSAPPGSQAGSEVSVEVCFEPHQLGEVRGQLSLSSGIGGEYIFPLHGTCLPPKAQGPFSVRAGRTISFPFKNVFLQSTAFSFQLDNPCFTVKGVETILPKKVQNIIVSYEAPAGGPPGPVFGRLTISTQHSKGHSKPCSWDYYLKGYIPDSTFTDV